MSRALGENDAEKNKQNNAEKDKLNSPPKKIDLRFGKAAAKKRIFPLFACVGVGGKTLKFSSLFLIACRKKITQQKQNRTEQQNIFQPSVE